MTLVRNCLFPVIPLCLLLLPFSFLKVFACFLLPLNTETSSSFYIKHLLNMITSVWCLEMQMNRSWMVTFNLFRHNIPLCWLGSTGQWAGGPKHFYKCFFSKFYVIKLLCVLQMDLECILNYFSWGRKLLMPFFLPWDLQFSTLFMSSTVFLIGCSPGNQPAIQNTFGMCSDKADCSLKDVSLSVSEEKDKLWSLLHAQ